MRKILRCMAVAAAASVSVLFATTSNAGSASNAGPISNAEEEIAPAAVPGNHQESLDLRGLKRTFIVHVPPTFDGKTKLPVVIMLHGAGGSGAGADTETGWGAKADREGFIAVFPDGTPPRPELPARFLVNPRLWNDGSGRGGAKADDIGFISAIIDWVESRYEADPARIYCTGCRRAPFRRRRE